MRISRVLIVDGYTDEPAGFGVPPYIDVYPRYIAGALWAIEPSIVIHYVTVDQVRRNIHEFIRRANNYDMVVVIAGAVVPGKYLGGEPIKLEELKSWFTTIARPFKILVGAAARWGIGNEGGTIATLPEEVASAFDVIVTGDAEAYIYDLARYGEEKAEPWRIVEDMSLIDKIAVKGAKIVEQHPNYSYNLTAEVETYRSCSRWITGGCSFCVTKLYGKPKQREAKSIVREVEALYKMGVRHFRLGRQADILVFGSKDLGVEEWPKPNPEALERLLYGIRLVAPSLKTLHIDNVNPGTIVFHKEESIKALKTIIMYHTPGDVAALGIETADPRVVKINNLKVGPEEAFEAVKTIYIVGARRGYNGLPEMLAGINFVLGLPGEAKETYQKNLEFVERLYREGILVRRINVRKVLVLPGTRLAKEGVKWVKRHERLAAKFRRLIMEYSARFLKLLVPRGTILKYLYVEGYNGRLGVTFARQAGSYPLVAEIPCRIDKPKIVNVYVYDYAGRSVRGLPVPLNINTSSLTALGRIIGSKAALSIIKQRPYSNEEEIRRRLGSYARYFSVNGFTC